MQLIQVEIFYTWECAMVSFQPELRADQVDTPKDHGFENSSVVLENLGFSGFKAGATYFTLYVSTEQSLQKASNMIC